MTSKMTVGLSLLFLLSVHVVFCTGAVRLEALPRLMRFKDGKPVGLPVLRAPVPLPVTEPYDTGKSPHVDTKEMVRRYIDEMLTAEIKLQQDKANLEKYVTEMLMWRKRAFPGPTNVGASSPL